MNDYWLPIPETMYVDNGDGTCSVEHPAPQWYSGSGCGFVPARRSRVARWWFDVRCWLAEKVLRVPVGDGW